MDFCGKSSGLADFENTGDSGSAVIFDADSYVRILDPKRNLDHRFFFSLFRNDVNELTTNSFLFQKKCIETHQV